MKTAKRMSRWKKILIWISVVVVALVAGVFVYLKSVTYSPSGNAEAAMLSDDQVHVTTIKQGYRFEPQGKEAVEPNIIFYPGGLVEPASYAPLARAMAEQGHRVYIAKMPLNLAIFGQNKADIFIAEHPDEAFVIGGHSLGGAFASRYAAEQPEKLEGIFYLASYADDGGSLKDTSLSALQITGTDDGVLNKEEWEKTQTNLPEDTTFVSIDGGNHGQFGSYGMQKGDHAPEITEDEQLRSVVQALDDWFNSFK
ncbi:alpha/beta hydrolase [Paenibacillus sp. MMS20-IR301]|uniref:alpha/beta hydrolase n=1 Tax=Paenibacillus sp. MMS20-IR301 TaxID=2895946 RepID=UPI0028E73CD6|nr:alpha/beta hydrolase [Paenibacillus sp. MMS20-IR301]WNS45184.1 alpha/beta hydrolase [Paenibacillus sp. MMS20-IR301]